MMTPEKFWQSVDRGDHCWVFRKRPYHAAGYRCVMVDGKKIGAHRYSWLITHGQLPSNLYVCHKCDNPGCVRPSHLFLGTAKDNMQDAKRKGRIGGIGKINGAKIHCPYGHPLSVHGERRRCDTCKKMRSREYARLKANAYQKNTIRIGRTKCVKGHPWVQENITVVKSHGRTEPRCKLCRRSANDKYLQRKKDGVL